MTCRSGWSEPFRRLGLAAVAASAAVIGMSTAPAAAADTGAPPADVVAQAGNGQLSVGWSAGDCGPAGITDNTVTVTDASGTAISPIPAPATATTAIVSGLTNGTGYQVTVTANCADGTTLTSAASEPVTPAGPPDPPVATAVAGDRSATVSWTTSGNGGSPVTGFTVTASPGGVSVSAGADESSAVVPGLTNGVAYTFTVTATNTVGSAASLPAGPVVPYGAPNAPLDVRVSTGDGSVTAIWTAPAENGQPIVAYSLSVSGAAGASSVQVGSAARQATVTGLTNGVPDSVTVSSVDGTGASAAAAAATATPGPPPGAPSAVSARPGTAPTTGGSSAVVSWPPAVSNGTPVSGYVVTTSPGGKTVSVGATATSATVPGLSPGQAYTFTVTATSSSGPGPVSKSSAPLTITPIDAAYATLGGPASVLGAPVNAEFAVGTGRERDYAAGRLYWSSTTGAHAVLGAILTKYLQLGGPTGFVGFPISDQTAAGAGQFSRFTGATVYWTTGSGAHEVQGTNLAHYLQLGGPTGFLGFPTTDETGTPDKVGRYNHFTGGSMYWSSTTGSHEVHGPIRDKWSTLGWERSFLGYPKTDQLVTGAGQSSQFTGGTVYWTSTTAAHEVHGANLTHYLQLGGPTGFLGFPTTDETATPDKVGRYNHFTGGSLYWTSATGSREVHGAIRAKWAALGSERSVLGYPTRDEVAVTGGRQSSFQHGTITWTPAKGAVSVTRGDDIVRLTRTHLGAPYVFGAAGPTTFDCSGLVQYVHRQIGISVPRTSEAQAAAARPIAKTAAQPGDLIFLLNNSHVGIYVGGGQMIDAPKTGDVVRQRAIWTSVYTVGRFW